MKKNRKRSSNLCFKTMYFYYSSLGITCRIYAACWSDSWYWSDFSSSNSWTNLNNEKI